MHNLTYQERARFAYADGNTELAEALEQLAEQEAIIERLDELNADLAELNADLAEALEQLAEQEAIIERLDELNADLLDVSYEVLPYMEVVADEDEGYKAGAVAKVVRNIKAVIKAVEES